MDVPSILSGGLSGVISGGAVVAIAAYISGIVKKGLEEEWKQNIRHEYAEKLANHKNEMDSKIEGIKHENQILQLRTSLFFDHQRNAFAALIAKMAEVNEEWVNVLVYDKDNCEPVPYERYNEFKDLINTHQLFLDEECLLALSYFSKICSQVYPVYITSEISFRRDDSIRQASSIVTHIDYVQTRVASIFREKIGVPSDPQHLIEVATLSAVELVNDWSPRRGNRPPLGNLLTWEFHDPADKVAIGLENFDELLTLLKKFDDYLSSEDRWRHEDRRTVKQALTILERAAKAKHLELR